MVKNERKTPKPRTKVVVSTKKQLEHEVQLQLVRHCRVWRFSVKLALEYCESNGHKISETAYHKLRNELKNNILQGEMFTKQALENLQVEHGDSLELLTKILDVVVKELREHDSTPIFITITNKKGEEVTVFNKAHSSHNVFTAIGKITEIMEKRDNTILATPIIIDLVNELNKWKEE